MVSVLLLAISLIGAPPVRGESGYYISDDGPWCYFSSTGERLAITCSGFSRAAGGFVHYACDYRGPHWVEWTCTDSYGNRWGNS